MEFDDRECTSDDRFGRHDQFKACLSRDSVKHCHSGTVEVLEIAEVEQQPASFRSIEELAEQEGRVGAVYLPGQSSADALRRPLSELQSMDCFLGHAGVAMRGSLLVSVMVVPKRSVATSSSSTRTSISL